MLGRIKEVSITMNIIPYNQRNFRTFLDFLINHLRMKNNISCLVSLNLAKIHFYEEKEAPKSILKYMSHLIFSLKLRNWILPILQLWETYFFGQKLRTLEEKLIREPLLPAFTVSCAPRILQTNFSDTGECHFTYY